MLTKKQTTAVPEDPEAQSEEDASPEEHNVEEARIARLEHINASHDPYRGGRMLYPFQVAPRKRVASDYLRGELTAGAEVRPEWVGGDEALESLVASRVVLKRAG